MEGLRRSSASSGRPVSSSVRIAANAPNQALSVGNLGLPSRCRLARPLASRLRAPPGVIPLGLYPGGGDLGVTLYMAPLGLGGYSPEIFPVLVRGAIIAGVPGTHALLEQAKVKCLTPHAWILAQGERVDLDAMTRESLEGCIGSHVRSNSRPASAGDCEKNRPGSHPADSYPLSPFLKLRPLFGPADGNRGTRPPCAVYLLAAIRRGCSRALEVCRCSGAVAACCPWPVVLPRA